MDETLIPVFALQTTSSYTLYGADIAAFAGLTSDLKSLQFPFIPKNGGLNLFLLDSIQFSSAQVPSRAQSLFSASGLWVSAGI